MSQIFKNINSYFVDSEVPSGPLNGMNKVFILTLAPIGGSLNLYLNGQLQKRGATNDYTLTGNTITFDTAPGATDILLANYRK